MQYTIYDSVRLALFCTSQAGGKFSKISPIPFSTAFHTENLGQYCFLSSVSQFTLGNEVIVHQEKRRKVFWLGEVCWFGEAVKFLTL